MDIRYFLLLSSILFLVRTERNITYTALKDSSHDCKFSPHNNLHYCHFSSKLSWHHARSVCKLSNGHLASIPDQTTNQFLTNLTQQYVWVGGRRDGKWGWVDNTTWNFESWAAGEPKNDSYMALNYGVGKWDDSKSSSRNGFICQYETSPEHQFLQYNLGDSLLIIDAAPQDRIWRARSEATHLVGFVFRADILDQCNYPEFPAENVKIGSVCAKKGTRAICGEDFLNGYSLSHYCCTPPTDLCHSSGGYLNCSSGSVLNFKRPCYGKCYNDYARSDFYHKKVSHYTCHGDTDQCIPIANMCQGGRSWCGDVVECDKNLRCIGGIANTKLASDLTSDHHYCHYPELHYGNAQYEYVDRSDENVTNTFAPSVKIDYNYLRPCIYGRDGVTCFQEENKIHCMHFGDWCNTEYTESCLVNNSTRLSSSDSNLCQNKTFWRNVDCNFYFNRDFTKVQGYGIRCSGRNQQCSYPYYYDDLKRQDIYFASSQCEDKSDRVHQANTSCPSSKTYLQIYADMRCDSDWKNSDICLAPEKWLEQQTKREPRNLGFSGKELYYHDPHGCWDSCAEPGPECRACTGDKYFSCHKSNMCVHKDLVCDGHPQCLNNEDEDFDKCKKKWVQNGVFHSHATVKCRSKIHPSMHIIATACNQIEECHDGSDESFCANDIVSISIVSVSMVVTVVVFFVLRCQHQKNTKYIGNRGTVRRIFYPNIMFEELKNIYLNDDKNESFQVISDVNKFLFHTIFSQKSEKSKEVLIEFYSVLEKLHNRNEAEIFAFLHRNLDPIIVSALNDAKFPGIKLRVIDRMERCIQFKFFTKIKDSIIESNNLSKFLSTIATLVKILTYRIDLAKDTALTLTLLIIIGGPSWWTVYDSAIYHFPTKFTSVIILAFAGTIIVPLLMCSIQLATKNPYMIFIFLGEKAKRINRFVMMLICLICSSMNHFFLLLNYEQSIEKAILMAKNFSEDDEIMRLFKECKKIKTQLMEMTKIDLGFNRYLVFRLILLLMII